MSVTIEAVSKSKIGLKINGEWVSCIPQVGNFVKVGGQYEIESQNANGEITRVKSLGGGGYQKQGGYQKPQGGYQKAGGAPAAGGAKKDWVDNSLGQSVGAAMNNAVALYVAGKIEESQIPQAAVALFLASESIKAAAPSKDFSSVGAGFKLVGAAPASAPAQRSYQAPSAPAQSASHPEFDMGGDDCPFDN